MAGLITVGGLATGLDTNKIIDELLAVERRPIDLLSQQIAAQTATKNAVGTLNGTLAALRAAAEALRTPDDVLVRAAESSDESVVGVAAGPGAARATTTFTVTQLARGSVAGATIGVASATSAVASGPGTFQFQVGTGPVETVALDGTTTLQALADAINELDAGVTATAVNLGTGTSPDFRLQIVTEATGAASTIAIVQDDTALALQTSQAGQDAQFTIEGFAGAFSRETNSFGDVLPGVTFTLRATGTATVTVDDDADAIVDQVKALVAAYNDALTFVARESVVERGKEDGDAPRVGSLATDSTVRRLRGLLQERFTASIGDLTARYPNLASLGLTTQRDGTIGFDEGKFRTALAADRDGVAEVFSGSGDVEGVADNLVTLLQAATGSGGTLASHTNALDDRVRALQDQIDVRQRTVDRVEANLRAQFSALESLVGQLQNQSSFLTSALSGR